MGHSLREFWCVTLKANTIEGLPFFLEKPSVLNPEKDFLKSVRIVHISKLTLAQKELNKKNYFKTDQAEKG